MLNLKSLVLLGTTAVLALSSTLAVAATTATGTVASEYLFRGIERSRGPAIQGSLDFESNAVFGLYGGVWASNTKSVTAAPSSSSQSEINASLGFKGDFSEDFGFDLGAIYYYFPQAKEKGSGAGEFDPSYPELYFGLDLDLLTLKAFYTNDFLGTDSQPGVESGESLYISAALTLEFSDKLSFVGGFGLNGGDGVKAAYGDEYADYSLRAVIKPNKDFDLSIGVFGTDLKGPLNSTPSGAYAPVNGIGASTKSDSARAVVSLTRRFAL